MFSSRVPSSLLWHFAIGRTPIGVFFCCAVVCHVDRVDSIFSDAHCFRSKALQVSDHWSFLLLHVWSNSFWRRFCVVQALHSRLSATGAERRAKILFGKHCGCVCKTVNSRPPPSTPEFFAIWNLFWHVRYLGGWSVLAQLRVVCRIVALPFRLLNDTHPMFKHRDVKIIVPFSNTPSSLFFQELARERKGITFCHSTQTEDCQRSQMFVFRFTFKWSFSARVYIQFERAYLTTAVGVLVYRAMWQHRVQSRSGGSTLCVNYKPRGILSDFIL